jgi:spore coat protein U-like protein
MRPLIGFALAMLSCSAHAQAGVSCTASMSSGVLSFGSVVPFSPAGVSGLLGEFVITCANPGSGSRNVRLRLAISAGASGTAAQRQMTRAGAVVPLLYNLYEDPAYTTVWTATTGGRPDEVLNVPGGGTAQLRRQVYGRIPGSQTTVTAGAYSDTLVAQVRY